MAFDGTGFLLLGCLANQPSTEKKVGGRLWAIFEGSFFMLQIFFEKPIAFALKSCIIPLLQKFFLNIFCPLKTWKKLFWGLRKFSNLSLLHEGLLLQDWVFRLGFQCINLAQLCDWPTFMLVFDADDGISDQKLALHFWFYKTKACRKPFWNSLMSRLRP